MSGAAEPNPRDVLILPPPAADALVRYGDHRDHVADVRFPAGGAAGPLVIVIHGGFWRAEYDRAHTGHLAAALAAEGYTVAQLEYRRTGDPGGGWPGTFDDIVAGISQIPALVAEAARASGRPGPPARPLLLVGHSAGGHLALWYAARAVAPACTAPPARRGPTTATPSHAESMPSPADGVPPRAPAHPVDPPDGMEERLVEGPHAVVADVQDGGAVVGPGVLGRLHAGPLTDPSPPSPTPTATRPSPATSTNRWTPGPGPLPSPSGPPVPDGVLALAPVADLVLAHDLDLDGGAVAALLGGAPGDVPAAYAAADPSPISPLRSRTVILHGTADAQVPIRLSERYASAAARGNHDVALIELHNADHFALIDPRSSVWPRVVSALRSLGSGEHVH